MKSKLVFWVVSHCETANRREDYVKNLQNFVTVDVFGKCGPLDCKDGMDCFIELAKNYKFYLAFENSLCSEYVTEKFWRTLSEYSVHIRKFHTIIANLMQIHCKI